MYLGSIIILIGANLLHEYRGVIKQPRISCISLRFTKFIVVYQGNKYGAIIERRYIYGIK